MTDLIQCKAPIEEISPKCDDGECLDCQYYIDDPEPSTMTEVYTVFDVLKAECNLEPLICLYCGSTEVVFQQYVGDAYCGDCGSWQADPLIMFCCQCNEATDDLDDDDVCSKCNQEEL